MPETRVVFYREDDGSVPTLKWLNRLDHRARAKCAGLIELLQELGHELRRPYADYLRDGIYELRTHKGHVRYRMLYFFHGNVAAVISHGIVKKAAEVPSTEIERAIRRKKKFEQNPQRHTQEIENE
ncbi:type II toxin-antitoxin system RelE/ParE family toxin [Candidatus Poribacteria bacterium]|nr:type II toxin-antitoxin system RelE/ParE family toxin [Candidatus Poribacteria bacterium]